MKGKSVNFLNEKSYSVHRFKGERIIFIFIKRAVKKFSVTFEHLCKFFAPLAYRESDQPLRVSEANAKIEFEKNSETIVLYQTFDMMFIQIINICTSNKLKLSFAMTMK